MGLNPYPPEVYSICRNCGRRTPPYLRTKNWEFDLPGHYYIHRCPACGWRWTEPFLSNAAVAALYPDKGYYAFAPPGPVRVSPWVRAAQGYSAPRWRRALAAVARPLLARRYYGVPRFIPGGVLIDVGAGSGAFLAVAAALGWRAVGVEQNPAAAARARAAGHDVRTGNGEDLTPLAGQKVDYFRFHHVLEHMAYPEKALSNAAALAAPGARLLVAVPNAGGLGARVFRGYWYHWAVPFHRCHFDPRTLTALLKATGWLPEKVYAVSSIQGVTRSYVAFLKDKAGVELPPLPRVERVLQTLLRPLLFVVDLCLLGDNVVVEATRTPDAS